MQKRKVTDPVPATWPENPYPIAIVGEAPGEEEALGGTPFMGRSGWLIRAMCRDAGIPLNRCLLTYAFDVRPVENNVKHFFMGKQEYKKYKAEGGEDLNYHGALGYTRPEYSYNRARLRDELARYNPKVVIALGGTAMWALTREYKITEYRGTITPAGNVLPEMAVLPTYAPGAVVKQWDLKPTVILDLLKARAYADGTYITPPNREIWINPTLLEVMDFNAKFIQPSTTIGVDIETHWVERLIRCVGISPDAEHCLVVPFTHPHWESNSYSYWRGEDEVKIRCWLGKLLADPTKKKLYHNGAYDIQWLANEGLFSRGEVEDTMILHHALQPELPKKLGVLGSLYTNEIAWKNMANFKEGNKKDS